MTTQTIAATTRPSLLGVALKLDAVVTGANGGAYLVLAGPLGDLFGLDTTLLRVVGAGLLLFAAMVWLTAQRPNPTMVKEIIAANAVWAAASVVVAIAGWGSPETVGTVWIVLQGVVVAGFAELQLAGLRRARSERAGG